MAYSKYLEFDEVKTETKTRKIYLRNKMTKDELGVIKWYGPFRAYSFFPEWDIVFDVNCMKDITNKIAELNDEHKKQLEQSK